MNPVLDAATMRALLSSVIVGLLTFFGLLVQTDDWKVIISVVGTAALTNFAMRAGVEGVYDSNRAKMGNANAGDVPVASPMMDVVQTQPQIK